MRSPVAPVGVHECWRGCRWDASGILFADRVGRRERLQGGGTRKHGRVDGLLAGLHLVPARASGGQRALATMAGVPAPSQIPLPAGEVLEGAKIGRAWC